MSCNATAILKHMNRQNLRSNCSWLKSEISGQSTGRTMLLEKIDHTTSKYKMEEHQENEVERWKIIAHSSSRKCLVLAVWDQSDDGGSRSRSAIVKNQKFQPTKTNNCQQIERLKAPAIFCLKTKL